MPDWVEYILWGGIAGFVAGTLLTRWQISRALEGKIPDEVGRRSCIMIAGEYYYLVTGPEYVEGVLKLRPSLRKREAWRP